MVSGWMKKQTNSDQQQNVLQTTVYLVLQSRLSQESLVPFIIEEQLPSFIGSSYLTNITWPTKLTHKYQFQTDED